MHSCRESLYNLALSNAQNAGLILARYLKEQKQTQDNAGEKAREELLNAAREAVKKGNVPDLYKAAFEKRKKHLDGHCETFRLAGRMVVGLGTSNVLETGLTLNPLYGTPLIPGSALKGLAAHYCSTVWGVAEPEFASPSGKHYRFMFGSAEDAGFMIFHDAWITPASLPTSLIRDVMTPHHGDYYMEKAGQRCAPSDFDDPNPVTFLSVCGKFDIHVSCDGEDGERKKEWEKLAMDLLGQALSDWGVGGKTSSGYGVGNLTETKVSAAPQNPFVGKTVKVQSIGRNKKGNLQFKVELDGKNVKNVKPVWEGEASPKIEGAVQAVVVSYNPGANPPELVLRPA
ncbi:MAG: type III-B CRISPR module RAMP protein Cmr6 [Synergistaceae bacterium]|jgi:CRISPR-associated protein Cmr6|nr:type III-B CRISPR module RAMP protein Cmr6 [Synergistaceae bacterium]